MELIFSDASEITIQKATCEGDYLKILSLLPPEHLRMHFEDPVKTKVIKVRERGQIIGEYEGYTQFYRTEGYTGGIYGVVNYKPEKTPEVQAEVQAAAVEVAKMQAQTLTDAQALTVKAMYKNWEDDPEGYEYKEENPDDKRRNYNGGLWNLNKGHIKQAGWYPGADPTLWTEIVDGHAGSLEDPIPVPESVTTSGFEYECGKYYLESGNVYLMDRQGMSEGEKVILYFPPSQTVGQYFSLIE